MSPSSPLEYVKQGDVEYFKTVDLNILQNFKGENGDGILALAAYEGQLDCCEVIYQRCPEQLFCQNLHGNSILHHVSHHRGGMLSMLEFFLDVGVKAEEDIESGVGEDNVQFKEWCKLQNRDRETALLRTVKVHNLEAARLWLNVDYDHKLELRGVANNDGNTPLHLAVGYEDLQMVNLLTRDKFDFKYVANRNGMTPFSLAIHRAQSRATSVDDPSVRIRQLILKSQPDQAKVCTGDNGWTLLHNATYKGDLVLVEDIIRFCPDCMDEVDSEGQNFFHIAAKFKKTKLVEKILSSKEISKQALNKKDNSGKTPYEIAALSGNISLLQCFLFDPRVNKRISKQAYKSGRQNILKARIDEAYLLDRLSEEFLMGQINVGLVVGALIATVSFTAGITVPGGYINEGPNLGMATLSKSASFKAFVISNSFAFILSLCGVCCSFWANLSSRKVDNVVNLTRAILCSLGAMFSMVVAFMTGSYAVLAISNQIAITVCVISSGFFVLAIMLILEMAPNIKIY